MIKEIQKLTEKIYFNQEHIESEGELNVPDLSIYYGPSSKV